jgi:hypothetical protein
MTSAAIGSDESEAHHLFMMIGAALSMFTFVVVRVLGRRARTRGLQAGPDALHGRLGR